MSGFRRIGVAAAALLVLLLGVAWVLPPLWDWSRQRETMEAFATAALGRPVRIEGAIGLVLLPEPMLTAGRVRVQGDAGTGELRIRSLRLGVALGPLLHGRVVARELVLRGPELRLPWPPATAGIAIPSWYAGFAGRIEDGQVSIGALGLRDVQANIMAGESGTLTLSGRVSVAGQAWQMSARIGQPNEAGVAAIDLTLAGRDRAMGNQLAFAGALGGARGLSGRLSMHGPDLSRWLPAPPVAFRAEGNLAADGAGWNWQAIDLDIGGQPSRAEIGMALGPGSRLRGKLAAARLDLDGWLPSLGRLRELGFPVSVELDVEAASLAGGTLRQVTVMLTGQDDILSVGRAKAVLPGDAVLAFAGQIRPEAGQPRFEGQMRIDAPDLRASLRWLSGAWGLPTPALPAGILVRASLAGDIALGAAEIVLTGLRGRVDQSEVQGQLGFYPGRVPAVRATLTLDEFALDPVLPEWTSGRFSLPPRFPGPSADVQLRIDAATWAGRRVDGLMLDAAVEPDKLVVRRLDGMVGGIRIAASGGLDAAGRLSDGRLEISAEQAAALAGWLPAGWRGQPGLWDGRAILRAEAAGPQDAVAMQIGLELGDARVEAQPVVDIPGAHLSGGASLRHPNAARFLAALGVAPWSQVRDVPAWPGQGSLALQAQLNIDEGQLSLDSFDLTAGALRTSGRLGFWWRDGKFRVGGRVAAETLPLPWPQGGLDEPLPGRLLRGWAASIQVQAGQVLLDEEPVLERLSCLLTQDDGLVELSGCGGALVDGLMEITARLDSAAAVPALTADISVRDARLEGLSLLMSRPGESAVNLGVYGADIDLTLDARGHSPAALRAGLTGAARLTAHDGAWSGFDLPAVRAALMQARGQGVTATAAALRDALGGGTTPFSTLQLAATLRGGTLDLRSARSTSPVGTVSLSGQAGLDGEGLDLRFSLQPARPDGSDDGMPELRLAVSGSAAAPRRVIDIAGALRWLAAPRP